MDIPTARKLKEAFDTILLHLNQEEVNAIAAIINRACDRLLQTEGDKKNHETVSTGSTVRSIAGTSGEGRGLRSDKGYTGRA